MITRNYVYDPLNTRPDTSRMLINAAIVIERYRLHLKPMMNDYTNMKMLEAIESIEKISNLFRNSQNLINNDYKVDINEYANVVWALEAMITLLKDDIYCNGAIRPALKIIEYKCYHIVSN